MGWIYKTGLEDTWLFWILYGALTGKRKGLLAETEVGEASNAHRTCRFSQPVPVPLRCQITPSVITQWPVCLGVGRVAD